MVLGIKTIKCVILSIPGSATSVTITERWETVFFSLIMCFCMTKS